MTLGTVDKLPTNGESPAEGLKVIQLYKYKFQVYIYLVYLLNFTSITTVNLQKEKIILFTFIFRR